MSKKDKAKQLIQSMNKIVEENDKRFEEWKQHIEYLAKNQVDQTFFTAPDLMLEDLAPLAKELYELLDPYMLDK